MSNSFPYSEDEYYAPRTAGILADTGDIPPHSISVPSPGSTTKNSAMPIALATDMTEYVGDTTIVYCNQINYNQMAGSD